MRRYRLRANQRRVRDDVDRRVEQYARGRGAETAEGRVRARGTRRSVAATIGATCAKLTLGPPLLPGVRGAIA